MKMLCKIYTLESIYFSILFFRYQNISSDSSKHRFFTSHTIIQEPRVAHGLCYAVMRTTFYLHVMRIL